MILEKLMVEEFTSERTIKDEYVKLKAIRSLSKLLSEIDFSVEVVPTKDPDRLKKLLTSLKGGPLSREEMDVVFAIRAKTAAD